MSMVMANSSCSSDTDTSSYPTTVTSDHLSTLKTEIRALINTGISAPDKDPLIGTIVRLLFHDCGGPSAIDDQVSICDGCIDYVGNGDHAGLYEHAVEALEVVYFDSDWCDIMSRPDFWATCSIIALEYALDNAVAEGTLPTIPYYFGRKTCGSSSAPGINSTAECDAGLKVFPSPILGWDAVFTWFNDNFDLDERETVAVLGAHTLGRAHAEATGFVASEITGPWVFRGDRLDNTYYTDLLNSANGWEQEMAQNNSLFLWVATTHTTNTDDFFIMLGADMALVHNFDAYFVDESTGEVTCNYSDCPTQNTTYSIVEEFSDSNQLC